MKKCVTQPSFHMQVIIAVRMISVSTLTAVTKISPEKEIEFVMLQDL